MTFKLPSEMESFIEEKVKTGEYRSAQEVVCAGLMLLKSKTASESADDFQPGEWDRLLADAEGTESMSLDDAIARRSAARARAKAGRQ